MDHRNEILTLINSIPLDLRAEVVVADILAAGFDAADLFIQPAGLFQRRFQKDILSVEFAELTHFQESVFINVSREGLYDMLPQTLIHNPPVRGSTAFKSTGEMVEDYRKRVAEEAEARKFFMIYEIEFYRQRIANALQERNLAEAVAYSMKDQEILAYWRLPAIFDNRQKGILFYLFPVFHKIRGSLQYMSEVYRMILQQEVRISRSAQPGMLRFPDSRNGLGNLSLALDSVLGNQFHYYYPAFVIDILRLEKKHFYDYLPGGRKIRILEKLNEYFVPVFCETELRIGKESANWILDDTLRNESRLGYSAMI